MLELAAPSNESLSLTEAAVWIARMTGSRQPHVSTVNRWALHGVRGVRLQGVRVGAKFWTTPDSIAAFLDALNKRSGERQCIIRASTTDTFQQRVRRKQVDDACAQLDSLCKGWDGPQSTRNETTNPSDGEESSRSYLAAEHQWSNRESK
jgi:hypothetical protein